MEKSFVGAESTDMKNKVLRQLTSSFCAVVCICLVMLPFMANMYVTLSCFVCGIIVSGLCVGLKFTKYKKFPIRIILYGLIVLMCVILFQSFMRGFVGFANSIIELWNSRFKVQGLLISGGNPSTLDNGIFFALVISAMSVTIETLLENNKFFVTGIFMFLLFEFFMLLRVAQSTEVLIAELISFGACWTVSVTYNGKGLSNLVFVGMTIFLSAVIVSALCTDFKGSPNVERFKEKIVKTVHNTRYGDDILPDGDMSKVRYMYDDSQVRLTAACNNAVTSDIYLYGYIGSSYDGFSKWSQISEESSGEEWNGMFRWLNQQEFYIQKQCAESVPNSGDNNINSIKIENTRADRSKVYVPFVLSNITDGEYKYNKDLNVMGTGMFGTSSYAFDYRNDINFEDVLINNNFDFNKSETNNVYNAYAKSVYTKLDDETKKIMNDVFFNTEYLDENSGLYSTISRVRAVLELRNSYSKFADTYYGDTNFAEWFLNDSRKGSSPYFATIGTLALRAAGYPARYAEGYYITNTDENDIEITSDDGHAWCEVYVDNIGWIPVEFTPGFYSQSLLSKQTVELSSDNVQGQGENNNTYQMSEQYRENDENSNKSKSGMSMFEDIMIKVVLLILFVIISIIVIVVRKTVIEKNRKIIMQSENSERYMYSYIFKMLKLGGVKCDSTRPLECVDDVTNVFGEIRAEEYRRMVSLMQKNIFGETALEKSEIHTLKCFCAKLRRLLYRKSSEIKKIKLRFINVI